MSFLLDTNLVSEFVKPLPNPGVLAWLAGTAEDETFLSVVTVTELRYGIERMPFGQKRERLADWLGHDLLTRFEGRILRIDLSIADSCGRLLAEVRRRGHQIDLADAFVAATVQAYSMTLVTRNRSDFEKIVPDIVSPWS